jgi:hypothetical protein
MTANDRQLAGLRARAFASYHACRALLDMVPAPAAAVLRRGALMRWRLARSLEARLHARPAARRRAAPAARLEHALLRLQLRFAADGEGALLAWLDRDSDLLIDAVRRARALARSEADADLLGARLVELLQASRATSASQTALLRECAHGWQTFLPGRL